MSRLIPTDANGPGALEAGAARYIDGALGDALAALRDVYRANLAALDAHSRSARGAPFARSTRTRRTTCCTLSKRTRAAGFTPNAAAFFDVVLGHTLEGTFGDPHYGGNRDFVGWELLGYPGIRLAVSADEQRMDGPPALTRLSAYDFPAFEHGDEHDR